MAKRETFTLSVTKKTEITPNMLRITVGGSGLESFPEGHESDYMKLFLEHNGKPVKRSYTVRAFRADALELDLDFVLHSEAGPASDWANSVNIGDSVSISGPGPVKKVSTSEDWYFLVADMTALPALSVNLEELPQDARGYAVIEIIEEADKQVIDAPKGIEVLWVVNPHPDRKNSILPDSVISLPWLEGKPNVWVACEFSGMRRLRAYFKQEHAVSKDEIYISSYWKMGETDEGHKKAKAQDNVGAEAKS